MARFRIVIWYPTINGDALWERLPLSDKLDELEKAVVHASGLFGGGAFQGVFVAPEYVLTEGGMPRPNELPILLKDTPRVFNRLEQLSARIPRVLFIPGSMMILSGNKVQNRVIGYFGGESAIFCGKRDDVGEAGDHHEFESGEGGGFAIIEGLRFGLQICRDASRHGYLQPRVDVHIVVSAGLALDNIVYPQGNNVAPRVTILAERAGTRNDRAGGGVEFTARPNVVARLAELTDTQIPDAKAGFALMKTVVVDYTD